VTFQGQQIANIHRVFGDFKGDAKVDDADKSAFRKVCRSRVGTSNHESYFDYIADGMIDPTDYFQFLARYKTKVNDDGSIRPF
jgi:hypothetical protein